MPANGWATRPATPAMAHEFCVFIGLCGDSSGGNSGSGGNGTGSAGPTPSAASNSKPPLSGETNGIPNGFRIPRQNIWNVLLPGTMQCDFGVCVPIGNGVLGGRINAATSLDPGLLSALSLMSNFFGASGSKPYVQHTVTQGECSDMRSSAIVCGYTCTFSDGEELPSVVYNKLQIRVACGKWSCPIGFGATKDTTHFIVPGEFDFFTTKVRINSGTCVYPSNP